MRSYLLERKKGFFPNGIKWEQSEYFKQTVISYILWFDTLSWTNLVLLFASNRHIGFQSKLVGCSSCDEIRWFLLSKYICKWKTIIILNKLNLLNTKTEHTLKSNFHRSNRVNCCWRGRFDDTCIAKWAKIKAIIHIVSKWKESVNKLLTEFHTQDPYHSKKNKLSHKWNLRPYSVGIRKLNGNKFKNTKDHSSTFTVAQTRKAKSSSSGMCQQINRKPSVNR